MDWKLIKELTEAPGVYGDLRKIKEFILSSLKGLNPYTDSHGNIVVKKGRPALSLVAHMDEVGFVVSRIEGERILMSPVGGINLSNLIGNYIYIPDKGVNLYIISADKHEIETIPVEDSINVEPGEIGVFKSKTYINSQFISGKALDDRLGCYLLIELLRSDASDFYGVFTAGEEIGTFGAWVMEQDIKEYICIETTGAFEHPGKGVKGPVLKKGPVLTVVDRIEKVDTTLLNHLIEVAKVHGIPYQFKQPFIGGTDCGRFKYKNLGTRTAIVAVPARYIHSPYGLSTKEDIENSYKILYNFLKEKNG